MELVIFSYYSCQPRIEVELWINLSSVPIVGDFIHVPGKAIKQISKKIKNRDSIMEYGLEFKVTKRLIYCNSPYKESFRIEIVPAKELEVVSP